MSDEVADDAEAPPLTEAEVLARVLRAEAEKSQKLTWSEALKLSWGVDVLTCECGRKRRLIAVITQAKVIKRILRHLGLPTEVVLKETQPVWRQNTQHCVGRLASCFPTTSARPGRIWLWTTTLGWKSRTSCRWTTWRRERGAGRRCAAELWLCAGFRQNFKQILALTRVDRRRMLA